MKGLHETFWGTTKKCENNLTWFLFQYNFQKCKGQEELNLGLSLLRCWCQKNLETENSKTNSRCRFCNKSMKYQSFKAYYFHESTLQSSFSRPLDTPLQKLQEMAIVTNDHLFVWCKLSRRIFQIKNLFSYLCFTLIFVCELWAGLVPADRDSWQVFGSIRKYLYRSILKYYIYFILNC